jgi:hypothetical protein
MKNTIYLILCFVFISCKKEKSIDESALQNPETATAEFVITMEVIVKEDDDFSVYYTQDNTINFVDEPLWVHVSGKTTKQQVVFRLPENVYPTQLRLDFGMNETQEDIEIHQLKFEFKNQTKMISVAELSTYFRPDLSKCTLHKGTITAIENNGVRASPSLYPMEEALGNFLIDLVY